MISIENMTKSFGPKCLFNSVNFKIDKKERIGLVGRNGHGKTTLLRIILGKEDYETGTIRTPKNYRIGYVKQNICFSKSTVLKEGMTCLIESEKNHHWKVAKILSGLGFSAFDMKQNPNNFSGGFQVRLNLAKILVSKPNLLLLDEPTNYLDITSIRWIIKFLATWPQELILITHDSSFMDKIITHTVGIHRKKIKKIKGPTIKFYTSIAKEEETYEKTRINSEKKQKEIFSFVERFRAKARLAGMVQSRIKSISKTKKLDKLEKLKSLDFLFKSKPCESKKLLSAKNISFAYKNQKNLFKNLNFSLKNRDRICIIGKNGKGKTTLLKIIAKIIKPTTGNVIYSPQIEKGVFEQTNINSLNDSWSVEEEILNSNTNISYLQVRAICGAMMFEGDSALKKISVLSGGEKNRVMLGKLLATPINLLLLDEPTNHLDIDSCNALLAAIDNFEGSIIMVTHNEMFIHSIAKRLIVFDKGVATMFEGCYQNFLDNHGWKEELTSKQETIFKDPSSNKKQIRRIRSNIINKKSKILSPIKKNINNIEVMIQEYEDKLNKVNSKLIEAYKNNNSTTIQHLSKKAHIYSKKIENEFNLLEGMENKLNELEIKFNERLLEIN